MWNTPNCKEDSCMPLLCGKAHAVFWKCDKTEAYGNSWQEIPYIDLIYPSHVANCDWWIQIGTDSNESCLLFKFRDNGCSWCDPRIQYQTLMEFSSSTVQCTFKVNQSGSVGFQSTRSSNQGKLYFYADGICQGMRQECMKQKPTHVPRACANQWFWANSTSALVFV